MLYTYDLHHNFGRSLTVEKFNFSANFSQFKHCHAVTHRGIFILLNQTEIAVVLFSQLSAAVSCVIEPMGSRKELVSGVS